MDDWKVGFSMLFHRGFEELHEGAAFEDLG